MQPCRGRCIIGIHQLQTRATRLVSSRGCWHWWKFWSPRYPAWPEMGPVQHCGFWRRSGTHPCRICCSRTFAFVLTCWKMKVLLFGQSAGSVNTFVISTLLEAPSLIKAAITESGGGRDTRSKAAAQDLGVAYAESVGCAVTDARDHPI